MITENKFEIFFFCLGNNWKYGCRLNIIYQNKFENYCEIYYKF